MKILTVALIVFVSLGLLAAPLATDAQQAGKVPRNFPLDEGSRLG